MAPSTLCVCCLSPNTPPPRNECPSLLRATNSCMLARWASGAQKRGPWEFSGPHHPEDHTSEGPGRWGRESHRDLRFPGDLNYRKNSSSRI